jgi:hypothetical protein
VKSMIAKGFLSRKFGVWSLALLFLALGGAGNVSASTVLVADTTLVSGSASDVFSFQVSGPGTVEVSLTNLDWPQPLSSLNFMATTPSGVLSTWSDPGATGTVSQTQFFTITKAGTYFADITATAGGALDLGVYSMCLTFNSVPLPSSGWLMSGALLIGLGLLLSSHLKHSRATAAV